jgi:hypothetical protein
MKIQNLEKTLAGLIIVSSIFFQPVLAALPCWYEQPDGLIGYAHISSEGRGLGIGIDVHDDYAYIADWNNSINPNKFTGVFQIFDVQTPCNPLLIPSSVKHVTQEIGALAVHDNFAFLANDANGLAVFDVSDTLNPVLLTSRKDGGAFAHSIYYQGGGFVYVGYQWPNSHLVIYDVSSLPLVPLPAPTVYQAVGDQVNEVNVLDDRAYIVSQLGQCGSGGDSFCVEIVDVTDPTTPTYISHIILPKVTYGGLGDLRFSGNYIYIAARPDNGSGGLRIIDITDESSPVIVGSINFPDIGSPFAKSWGLDVGNNQALLAAPTGLYSIDVSVPENPVLMVKYHWPVNFGDSLGGAVEIRDNLVYTTVYANLNMGGFGGIAIYKLFDPEIFVAVDIKPKNCPSQINVKSKGKLPVSLLGTEFIDVSHIDPESIRLNGVAPSFWSFNDIATPFKPYRGKEDAYTDCTESGSDGYLDLQLKFQTQNIVEMLGVVSDGEQRVLNLTGNLKEEFGGTAITGEDIIIIMKKGK